MFRCPCRGLRPPIRNGEFHMLRFDFLISRDNLLMGRLFSGSVVRRAATQAPLTTFTEDEEVMRESGMTFAFPSN